MFILLNNLILAYIFFGIVKFSQKMHYQLKGLILKKMFLDNIINDNQVIIKKFDSFNQKFKEDIKLSKDIGIFSIIDTETTGLDIDNDEIIEIAIRQWYYDRIEHKLLKPLDYYASLNQPSHNVITPEITEITGIKAEDVDGKKIDWGIVKEMMAQSDFILAHNASFDRPMIENVTDLSETSQNKIWVCSLKQVNWLDLGFLSSKQELLCLFHGFYYDGHRALTDIDALGNLLFVGGYLKNILADIKTKYVKVECLKAPFESKDLLKKMTFYWDPDKRCWSKYVKENELDEIMTFLTDKVYYPAKSSAKVTKIDIRDRFKKHF